MSCFSAIQQVSQLQLMSRNHHLQTVKVSDIRCYYSQRIILWLFIRVQVIVACL